MFAFVQWNSDMGPPRIVEQKLRQALAGISGVQFMTDGQSLFVSFRTESRIVTRPNKTGKPSKPFRMVTPGAEGFKLQTYEFPHRSGDPARPTQAVRMSADFVRNYGTWKTDAGERQVDNSQRARYFYLEWGPKTDPKLLAKVREIVETGTHPMVSRG